MRNQKELKELYRECLQDVWDDHMTNYCMKETAYIVELSDGSIIPIDKPRIQKDFCFGYGFYGRSDEESEKRAFDMAAKARTDETYFIEKNLEQVDSKIKLLQNLDSFNKAYIYPKYNGESEENVLKDYSVINVSSFTNAEEAKELQEEDIQKIIAGLEEVRKQFKKRLDTYLKRYGLSKLNVWTYLRD